MNKKVKLSLKIAGGVLGVFIVSILVCAQISLCTTTKSNYNDHSSFFKDIAKNNTNFNNVKLSEISMLGSHDAMSDKISYSSKSNTSENNLTNNKFVMFFAKGAAVRYARAQNDDIYNQLKAGVRYIDARITYVDGVYYNSHGFISDTFENNLKMILQFLDENPGEFIIFDINDFYPGKDSDYTKLETYIKSVTYKDKSLFDYDKNSSIGLKELTYEKITNNGNDAGAVIYSKEKEADGTLFRSHLKDGSKVNGTSTYKTRSKDIIKQMNEYKDKYNSEKAKETGIVINQAQMSTSYDRWFQTFCQWSLLAHAYKHNLNVIKQDNIDDILDAMPIYMCDYATSNSNKFNDLIIDKMYQRNIKLQ